MKDAENQKLCNTCRSAPYRLVDFRFTLNFIVLLSQEGPGQLRTSETPSLSTEATNAHPPQVGRIGVVVFINFPLISDSNLGPG